MKRFKKASEITVGVVGYGGAYNMGRAHLTQMKQAGMTPLAVVEVDPERLAVAKTDFPGIETYTSVSGMLAKSKVQLVVLITPHNTHAPLALQCLKAGRHVISEKPLAITTRQVDQMIAAAKKSAVMLSTYHNRHWDGCIQLAVDLVKKQRLIGDIVRIEAHMGGYGKPKDWWRSSRSISGGILYDWGVHLLEYSLQLIEAPVIEVSGFAKEGFWAPQTVWKKDTTEDEGFAVIRFKGGQWLTLSISSIDSKAKDGQLEITGTTGTIVVEGRFVTIYQNLDGKTVTTRMPTPPDEGHRYYENVCEHLVAGKPLVINSQWARRPVHLIDLAMQSAKKGRAMSAVYG